MGKDEVDGERDGGGYDVVRLRPSSWASLCPWEQWHSLIRLLARPYLCIYTNAVGGVMLLCCVDGVMGGTGGRRRESMVDDY